MDRFCLRDFHSNDGGFRGVLLLFNLLSEFRRAAGIPQHKEPGTLRSSNLRSNTRIKDGKQHRYFTVVESRRLQSGKVAQRQVLYLGGINDSQQAAWCRTLEVFDEAAQRLTPLILFPEDRPVPAGAIDRLQVKLSEMKLERARPYGNCWLGCELWRQLQLDRFWSERLPRGRESVAWPQVLELFAVNRLIDPGSEFRLHRQWFDQSAMDVLLGQDFAGSGRRPPVPVSGPGAGT